MKLTPGEIEIVLRLCSLDDTIEALALEAKLTSWKSLPSPKVVSCRLSDLQALPRDGGYLWVSDGPPPFEDWTSLESSR